MLDPSAFRSFELMAGPASVRYGSGALGGVISATPWRLRRKAGFGGRGGLRGASQDTAGEGWAHVDGRFGDVAAAVGGAWRQRGQLRLGGGAKAPLSDYTQGAYHGQAGWDLSDQTRIIASWRGSRIGHAGRIDRLVQGRLRIYDNADDFGSLEVRHRAPGRTARLVLAYHRTNEEVARFDCAGTDDISGCVAAADDLYYAPGRTPGATLKRERRYRDAVSTWGGMATTRLTLVPRRLDLQLGAEVWADTVDASEKRDRRGSKSWTWKTAKRGNFSTATTWLDSGAWANAEATLWRGREGLRLMASGGGRLARFAGAASAVPGVGDVSYAFTGVVGAAGLRLLAAQRWMLYMDVS